MREQIRHKLGSIVSSIVLPLIMTPPIVPWHECRDPRRDGRDGDAAPPRHGRRHDERDDMRDDARG